MTSCKHFFGVSDSSASSARGMLITCPIADQLPVCTQTGTVRRELDRHRQMAFPVYRAAVAHETA